MAGFEFKLDARASRMSRAERAPEPSRTIGDIGDAHLARVDAAPAQGLPRLAAGEFPAVIDLGALNAADGFKVQGDLSGDAAGWAVSNAGDVNNDGFDDFLVGAPFGDDGGLAAGEGYLLFGKAGGFANIDLENLAAANGFVIQGDGPGDQLGKSLASAGDINGDGFDDLIIGAPGGDNGDGDAGEAYVIFGKANGFARIDLATLAAADGFIIQGDAAGDQAGFSVASAGDINGDGFDDIVVGAVYDDVGDTGGVNAGQAYVLFGKAGGFANIDLSSIPAGAGFAIQGDAQFDFAGWDVASAGDINNDGFDDLIVGAPLGDNSDPNAGEAYVLFGKASGFANIDLGAALPANAGFVIQGDPATVYTGVSVASVGDINGDGFDDIAVGSPLDGTAGAYAGETFVIFGKASGFSTINLASLDAAAGFVIRGDAAGDDFGRSIASAGDINGDGFADIIIGATKGDNGGEDAGEAYVIYGKAGGFGTIDLTGLTPDIGFTIQGDAAGDDAGWSVSGAGDINGDGLDDLIVGARNGDDGGVNAGEAYIIYGRGDTGPVNRTGTAASDTLTGGAFDDTLSGLGSADRLEGRAGSDSLSGGKGRDLLLGEAGADTLIGDAALDVLMGGLGADVLNGGAGRDVASYANAAAAVRVDLAAPGLNSGEAAGDSFVSIEDLFGSAFRDTLAGNSGRNRLDGGLDHDMLDGRQHRDTLSGGAGRDTLTGGADEDRFELTSTVQGDRETITDFVSGTDEIALLGSAYGLSRGALAAGAFRMGTAAGDASDRIVYDQATGQLFFDADGTGATAQVRIATLLGAPPIVLADFIVI